MTTALILVCALMVAAVITAVVDVRGDRPHYLLAAMGLLAAVPVFMLCGLWAGLAVLLFSGVVPAAAFYYAQRVTGLKTMFKESLGRFSVVMPALVLVLLVFIMNRQVFDLFMQKTPAAHMVKTEPVGSVMTGLVLLAGAGVLAVLLVFMSKARVPPGEGK